MSFIKIEAAEAILLQIDAELSSTKNKTKLAALSKEYYATIPRAGHSEGATINTYELLEKEQELCQILKDLLQVLGAVFFFFSFPPYSLFAV
jgi:hypothetical protein